ncbi:MAG: agmatine deiminase family protein [Bacteroidetes bacterium]|nr:agmatine deiminase family protein [Bacteroidota bacterium]
MRILVCFVFIFCSIFLKAQTNLPVGATEAEKILMPSYLQQIQSVGITTPPGGGLRTMAEWEEIKALTITWTSYLPVLREIVRATQIETQVYIVCSDSNVVKNYLTSNSIPLINLHYVIAPFNTIWIRDYGQNCVYRNDVDSMIMVDWIYNRPRPKDDTIPSIFGREFSIPLYETSQAPYDLIHTGGNFMSDGLGTAFSSELVVDENPTHTVAEIDTIMHQFMGIDRYIKMPVLPYDGIHHIDMHMKLLDEETLMIGEYASGVSDGPQIEANLQYVLSNFNSIYGTPYKVVRIVQPPDANGDYPSQAGDYLTYTNAVFVNKTVLLPTYNNQYDTTAIRIWQETLPGYSIVGVPSSSIIGASGAVHCITHCIGADEPLLISHQQLSNTINTSSPYQVDARIQHKSGIQTANIFWTTDTSQVWQSASMILTNVTTNNWTGFIPAQTAGAIVYYYISASSTSGKTQVRPMPAPLGWWKFEVSGSTGIALQTLQEFSPAYPNPSHGITCVPINITRSTQGRLTLIDMSGREVLEIHSGNFISGEKNYFFNSSELAPGAYMILLQTNNGIFAEKLMVK